MQETRYRKASASFLASIYELSVIRFRLTCRKPLLLLWSPVFWAGRTVEGVTLGQ